MESWIEVIDRYKVSNLGEVYSTRTNKVLKKHTDRYGYLYVGVYINGRLKFKKVHRLVAKAFLSNYSDDLQVNHKNEDKKDGRYLRREFSYSKFQQTMVLPDNVEKDKIEAKVENGVLSISIPKRTEEEAKMAEKVIEIK